MDDFKLVLRERLKAAKQRPSIHGYEPHANQQRFHASSAQGRLYIGGNRSGKTVGGAAESVRALLGIDPNNKFPKPPLRGRCVSVDRLQGIYKITLPEIVKWLPPSALINGSVEDSFNKSESNLRLSNGSSMDFLTYQQELEQHAGTSRHFIWFDEEPDEAIFNENMMRLVDTNGLWWCTMTPVEGLTWIYDKIYKPVVEENKAIGIDIINVHTDDNPHVNPAAMDILQINMTPEEKESRRRGEFSTARRLIYGNFEDSKNVIDSFLPPSQWLHINAMDHGLRNPTAWLFAAIDPSGSIYVFDEYYQTDKLIPEHAQTVLERELRYGEPSYRIGDPSIHNKNPITGTSVQQEYADRGLYIIEGNNQVNSGIARVKTYFGNPSIKPRLFITSNCTNLIRELRGYRWASWASKKDELRKEKKEEPEKKNDHAVDALRYLVASRPDGDTGEAVIQTRAGIEAVTALTANDERYAREWDEDRVHFNSSHAILGSEY